MKIITYLYSISNEHMKGFSRLKVAHKPAHIMRFLTSLVALTRYKIMERYKIQNLQHIQPLLDDFVFSAVKTMLCYFSAQTYD